MTNRAIKKLVDAVMQAVENRDTKSIKSIIRRGSHADFIFPSVTEGRVRLSARNLFFLVNATVPDIIQILAETSPTCILSRRDDDGHTPLDKACQYSCPEAVKFLLPRVNIGVLEDFGRFGTLLYAVENCAEYAAPIASLLLDAGANINCASVLKRTALMYAVKKSALEMRCVTSSTTNQIYSFTDLCMLLIDRGCDVNAADLYGQTALHFAIMEKQEILVRKLLISGSDIDRRDVYGFTPFYYAIRNGTQTVIDLFITSGAKLQIKDWKQLLTNLAEVSGNDFQLLSYVIYQSKQCLSLQKLCNISIRKNLRNVEKDSIQLGLPPLLVKRLQLRD